MTLHDIEVFAKRRKALCESLDQKSAAMRSLQDEIATLSLEYQRLTIIINQWIDEEITSMKAIASRDQHPASQSDQPSHHSMPANSVDDSSVLTIAGKIYLNRS